MNRDIYQEVTNTIVRQLESGVRPWAKPWGSPGGSLSMPTRANGEKYRGINVVLLWGAAEQNGFTSTQWFTFKQAQELGASVRKGSKGSQVVYFSKLTRESESGEDVEIPFLKTYSVFNADQIDNLPEAYQPAPVITGDAPSPIPTAEAFFAATGADIRNGGSLAFFIPSQDFIQMPPLAAFKDAESYYATLAHETVHWTGHKSRLEREFGKRFGDEAYAVEELCAEIGSAFLASDLGLYGEPREDHAAYLASWLKVLKADKRAIFTAASKAQAAVDFIHEQAKTERPVKADFRPVEANVWVSAHSAPEAVGAVRGPQIDHGDDDNPEPPKGGGRPSRKAALALYQVATQTHKRADWKAAAHAMAQALMALDASATIRPQAARTIEAKAAPKAQTLIEFLSTFGVRDDGGELRARDADIWHKDRPFRRRLIRPDGVSLEHAAMRAWEAGFFPDIVAVPWDSPDNMTPVDAGILIAAIERELRGSFDPDYAHAMEDFERWDIAA